MTHNAHVVCVLYLMVNAKRMVFSESNPYPNLNHNPNH